MLQNCVKMAENDFIKLDYMLNIATWKLIVNRDIGFFNSMKLCKDCGKRLIY